MNTKKLPFESQNLLARYDGIQRDLLARGVISTETANLLGELRSHWLYAEERLEQVDAAYTFDHDYDEPLKVSLDDLKQPGEDDYACQRRIRKAARDRYYDRVEKVKAHGS